MKWFLVFVFLNDDTDTLNYWGPFETEEACYQPNYLHESGVLFIGTCKLLDIALVPSRPT